MHHDGSGGERRVFRPSIVVSSLTRILHRSCCPTDTGPGSLDVGSDEDADSEFEIQADDSDTSGRSSASSHLDSDSETFDDGVHTDAQTAVPADHDTIHDYHDHGFANESDHKDPTTSTSRSQDPNKSMQVAMQHPK